MKWHSWLLKRLARKMTKLKDAFDEAEREILDNIEKIEKITNMKAENYDNQISDLQSQKAQMLDERDSVLDQLSKSRNEIITLRKNMFEK